MKILPLLPSDTRRDEEEMNKTMGKENMEQIPSTPMLPRDM